jgi:hypothetical protein
MTASSDGQLETDARLMRQADMAGCAVILLLLTGCMSLPKPSPTPAPVQVVCAPEAMQACAPVRYALPPGDITADQAAAIAIAERAAWCECAMRHTALRNCVMAHNGSGREMRGPCETERYSR